MFVWRYLGANEEDLGKSEPFEDQEAAESWLSEAWAGLSERGVEEVELFDHDNGVCLYRMGLEPEADS